MGARDDKRAELQAALEALDAEDADDEDYEIEIYAPSGAGARVPYRKGKGFLAEHFGIDADTLSKPTDDGKAGKSPKATGKSGTAGNADDDSGNAGGSNLKFLRQNRQQGAS
jgi:hypothetical protein